MIHVNEIRAGRSVPYGTGEVDFPGLMRRVAHSGYVGDIVVELELESQQTDPRETIPALRDALVLLERLYNNGTRP